MQGFNFLIPARDVAQVPAKAPGRARRDSDSTASGRPAASRSSASATPGGGRSWPRPTSSCPTSPTSSALLAEAEFKVKNPPPRPFPWIWVALGVTLVSVGVYGGHVRAALVEEPLPDPAHPGHRPHASAGADPVLLDVRTKTDYRDEPAEAARAHPALARGGRRGPRRPDGRERRSSSPTDTSPEEAAERAGGPGAAQARLARTCASSRAAWAAGRTPRLPMEAKSRLPSIGLELYKNLTLGDIEKRHFKQGRGHLPGGRRSSAARPTWSTRATVEIRRRDDGSYRVLTQLGEGELVGQMALFRKGQRSADHHRGRPTSSCSSSRTSAWNG